MFQLRIRFCCGIDVIQDFSGFCVLGLARFLIYMFAFWVLTILCYCVQFARFVFLRDVPG